jgi:ATP-dependent RNA helicase DeaD
MGKQIDALAAGAQVVVGTPGRVLDHLKRGTFDASHIRMLVLDEADEMLSMGFERELSEILSRLPANRQTLLFSATLPPDIERMARERLKQPEFITLSGDHVGALSIRHFVYLVTEDKISALLRVIETENPEGAVVFCNTKVETEAVASALQRAGFDADWLNGDLAQNEREEVMGRVRAGKLRFLVATDVAARGIDVSHLTHVINYDFPEQAESYVHRTGRTGRAGRTGTAISLVRAQDIGNLYLLRLTYQIRPIERQLPTAGELRTRRDADLLQMVVDSFAARPVHPEDLLLARRLLTHDDAERIVASLLRTYLGERQPSEDAAAAARRAKAPKPMPLPTEPRVAPATGTAGAVSSTSSEGPRRERERESGPRRDRDRDRPRADRDRPREERRPRDQDRPAAAGPRTEPLSFASPSATPPAPAAAPTATAPTATAPTATAPTATAPTPAATIAAAGTNAPNTDSRQSQSGQEPRRPRTRVVSPPMTDEPVRYFVGDDGAPVTTLSPAAEPAKTSSTPTKVPAVQEAVRPRNRLIDWHPPEEDGDDAPILRDAPGPTHVAASPASPTTATTTTTFEQPAASVVASVAPLAAAPKASVVTAAASVLGAAVATSADPSGAFDESYGETADNPRDYGEIFVDVGRREGVRPADLQRVLRDRGNISRRETGRIRVRDKHTFVSVRREVFDRALEALTGVDFAGRTSKAEAARSEAASPGTGGEAT